jgi:ribonucleoside-diphosphate reductase alpha chain
MDLSQKILSDITHHMKYARFLKDEFRRETYEDTVKRNMDMHIAKYPQLEEEIRTAYQQVFDRKVLPSMRSMQFGGRPIEVNPVRIFNCAFLAVDDIRAFNEIMFLLLGGTGVGYSVQKHHVEKLPEIRKPNPKRTRRFLVGDSIEGWADSVKALMRSYFEGGSKVVFDFRDIRPKGARLVTAGGKAPGPQPLKECLIKLEGILEAKEDGDKLEPIEVHDIICYIADAVLAGGIRRSALICLFSADDDEMIACKSGAWWESNPQRGRANNSAVILRHRITKDYFMDLWARIKASGAGEPGIFFTNDKEWGTNPCITGDALVTVKDHDTTAEGEVIAKGGEYQIPLKNLVELYKNSALPPMVLSYNAELKTTEWDMLDAAELTKEKASIIELTLDNGGVLKLTPDHKVFTENRGWIVAADLTDEDVLLTIK